MADYRIEGNRRCTNQIMFFVNQARADDLEQVATRGEDGPEVELLVGEPTQAVEYFKESTGGEQVVLARRNDDVAMLRRGCGSGSVDPWPEFREIDSSSGRPDLVEALLSASVMAESGRFGEGVALLGSAICGRKGSVRKPFKRDLTLTRAQRDGLAMMLVESLLRDSEGFKDRTLAEVYGIVAAIAATALAGLEMTSYARKGRPRVFADETSARVLLAGISVREDTRHFRTIHKAKSAEFQNVLVCLESEQSLDHVLASDRHQGEEQRVTYVAITRARDRLAIAVPTLSTQRRDALRRLTVKIVDLR